MKEMHNSNSKEVVIRVSGLTKRFRYWDDRPTSFKTVLINLLRGQLTFGERQEFTVIEDTSFVINKGDFIGIMGRNGVGKSTLLKLICGIYTPTMGEIQVSEPIAPLIELGAGFHPDLSGYENIFLNAAILGFGRKATLNAVDQILEFSELGEKIWMPMKNYSSGMLVRLGFSIATHLAAPILLIDEVLAVGDVGFQAKSLKKIHELHAEGRTIVLITHDPASVREHCNRCIVIDHRKKIYDGLPGEGVEVYLQAVTGAI